MANTLLATLHHEGASATVLTGAGISVGSGIPAYRNRQGQWLGGSPIQHQDFIKSAASRRRYWSRSLFGWPRVAAAQPNKAHDALVKLAQTGFVSGLVTQNVDRLHQRAGQPNVVDLHGRLDKVRCLDCNSCHDRVLVQRWLERDNPDLQAEFQRPAPDGDAGVPDALVNNFIVPECPDCAGVLMPDVVFFGASVPRTRVEHVERWIADSDLLLVIGSSLAVFSGFRFCRSAHRQGKPIIIINDGDTRADELASECLPGDCATTLESIS